MVDKAQPSSRMFQEHIGSFLTRLPLFVVENVLSLESLIYRQVNRIIWIGYSPWGVNRRVDHVILFVVLLVGFFDVDLVLFVALLRSFNWCRNPFMVRFVETRCSLAAEAVQEWQPLRVLLLQVVFALLAPC